ncbi:MAG: energy transducer TonB [Pyrinomonadaceae bacterium]|jgi:protein TonB|nr:energy transducer TonB [Pyrinomonadaceae bacterium]
MLDQLIESRNNAKENVKRASFLATTTVLVFSMAFSATLWSLFAKDIAASGESLTLSSLVTPVPITPTEPPKPEPIQKSQQKLSSSNDKPQIAIRNQNIARIDETQSIPDKVSSSPSNLKARPDTPYKIAAGKESDYVASVPSGRVGGENDEGNNVKLNRTNKPEIVDKDDPPPVIEKKIKVEEKPKPEEKTKIEPKRPVSGGVLNGKAKFLPSPTYSAAAKAVNATGEVTVQVLIDESGNVISATAVSGHPLLRAEAVKAAKQATFSPTKLSNIPVKVNGIITYRFSK